MDSKAKQQDHSYAERKKGKPMPINDGADHEVTEKQKRVNIKKFRRMIGTDA